MYAPGRHCLQPEEVSQSDNQKSKVRSTGTIGPDSLFAVFWHYSAHFKGPNGTKKVFNHTGTGKKPFRRKHFISPVLRKVKEKIRNQKLVQRLPLLAPVIFPLINLLPFDEYYCRLLYNHLLDSIYKMEHPYQTLKHF